MRSLYPSNLRWFPDPGVVLWRALMLASPLAGSRAWAQDEDKCVDESIRDELNARRSYRGVK